MVLNTYGRSTGFCIDPIEKKPLNHFYPGTSVLSFGTAGCNLGCKFCQNHDISKAREVALLSEHASSETVAHAAQELGCRSVAFTYNDPVVWAEYAIDTAKACRAVGVKTVAVTAGYITAQARPKFYEYMDAANVDLKAFTEEFYYQLTLSHLQPVLDTLEWLKKETNVWFEITNLVIPGANDTADEFQRMCDWLLDHIGDDTPIHFSAFHPDFKMLDRPPTPVETLLKAYEVARNSGLKHVYVGNVHDETHQSTYCSNCGKLVIERNWYELGAYHLRGGHCGQCGSPMVGRFDEQPGDWGRCRMPVSIGRYAAPSQATTSRTSQSNSPRVNNPKTMATQSFAPAVDAAPQISSEQQQEIHRAASRWVALAVTGRTENVDESRFAGVGDHPLMGVFVSLKRQKRLRGCCGVMGAPIKLRDALVRAARRTALEDNRLPPVSASELAYLDLEVWLLYRPRTVELRGIERIRAITIGKHGIQIAHGENRGLLLPGVAIENDFDAETFLKQVCIKAGLPPDTWKDDEAQLQTFEGLSVSGPFDGEAASFTINRPQLTAADLATLANFCRQNVRLLLRGATPNYYMPGPEGAIHGAALSLTFDGNPFSHVSKLSFRPELPLQSTLFALAEAAAQAVRAAAPNAKVVQSLDLNLTLLDDPAMHGTVETPDLRGFDPTTRALVAIERRKSAWVYDAGRSPQEALEVIRSEIQVLSPHEAGLYSFRALSTNNPAVVSSVPRATSGPVVRPPAVAGAFYPSDPNELQQLVDQLLEGDAPPRIACQAILVPHAGLKYSGKLAADVFKRVEIPQTVIVIGPKHTPFGVEWAVAPHRTWALPGASIDSDPELASHLASAVPGLQLDYQAHQQEHAIEVELPLLASLSPHSRVVGIAVGVGDLQLCGKFAEGLARVLQQRNERVLLVISSDMNHFAGDAENRRLDQLALNAMETCDPATLYNTVRENQISMCGVLPAVIVLDTLRRLGRLTRCERIGYSTSADVTGDKTRVVGYAGALFY